MCRGKNPHRTSDEEDAGFAYVDSMIPRADLRIAGGPVWFEWGRRYA
jgi:hypothetical protein